MFYLFRGLFARIQVRSRDAARCVNESILRVEELENRVVPSITAVIDPAPLTGPEGTAISLTSTVTDAANPIYSWTVVKDSTSTPFAIGTTPNFQFTPMTTEISP